MAEQIQEFKWIKSGDGGSGKLKPPRKAAFLNMSASFVLDLNHQRDRNEIPSRANPC